MDSRVTRRSFIKAGAAAGVLASGTAQAAEETKSPSSRKLLEIGIITCGYYSHIENIWGKFLNPTGYDENGVYWPRQTGMVMTMVWDPDRKAAESFAKKYDLKVVDHYDDMVGKVDGIIMSDYYATGWWPKLSRPYLETGMPTLINRPFALSLDDMYEMIDLSRKHDAPIFVPSSDETQYETVQAQTRVKRLLADGGQVTGVMAFEPCGEYPAHGVHGIYNIHSIVKPDVAAVGMHANKWWEWGLEGGMMTWLVNGADGAPDYYAALRMSSEPDTNGWVMVSTTKGRVFSPNDHIGEVFTRYRNMFMSTMIEFQRVIETRKMHQTHEHIIAKTKTFLTGFYSQQERGGEMVRVDEVPRTWRAPEVMPERIPDSVFR